MKVAQLLEINYSKKHTDGQRVGYGYGPYFKSQKETKWDAEKGPREYTRQGIIVGMVGDWLEEMGAVPKDLAVAMEKARHSEEYKELLKIGFEEVDNKRAATNGTFIFRGRKGAMLGDDGGTETVLRRILANGRITSVSTFSSGASTGYTGRLKSAEPATIKTQPNMTPVERLVSNYVRAFAGLHKVQAPKFKAALRARLQAGKEAR